MRTRVEKPGPPSQAFVELADVLEHAEGLVCLSGCALRGVHDEFTLRRLLDAFGPDRLRVELQRPFLRDDRARNRRLQRVAARLGVPCVATGNVHAHARARAPLQDALVAVRLHTTLDASEPERRGNFSHVLASPAAMASRFADHPEAVAETLALAERLRFDLTSDLGYRYPGAEDAAAMRTLTELCQDAPGGSVRGRRGRCARTPLARLEQELRIIERLGLPGFFLLHHDMLELAREVALEVRGPGSVRGLLPPGRGRGSSVSSIVCFLTGLSHVDPIANDLLIGRFLNEELTSLPDIDLDFPRDIREKLIPRVHERYGHDRSALVAAFPTYRARGAIRELGKALGLPPGEIERVARGSEGWDAKRSRSGHRVRVRSRAPQSRRERGSPRGDGSLGVARAAGRRGPRAAAPPEPALGRDDRRHPSADRLLPDRARGDGGPPDRSVGQGLLLGCGLPEDRPARARDAVGGRAVGRDDRAHSRRAGRPEPDPVRRPGDVRVHPERRHDRGVPDREPGADAVAVPHPAGEPQGHHDPGRDRPAGADPGRRGQPYIERRQRLRVDPDYQIPYEHPSLEPALRETLGAIIFQDQVIEVAIAFAGFSPGEAEGLRRAMSRKRSDAAIEAYHRRFVAGARRRHGVDEETAERVFSMVRGFSGFGFPKAHGAAFGLLAYQSTWLRVHFGPEFLCSLLNEQPMGFYPPDALVHEAQRRGIEVLAPDVNESAAECEMEGGSVRIGLGYVRGVTGQEVSELAAVREAGGRFRSLADLASRASSSAASLEMLAWSGACDSLVPGSVPGAPSGSARRIALWQLGVATPGRRVPGGVQLALPLDLPAPPELRALTAWESMLADYGTTGLTADAHPIALLRDRLPQGVVTSRELGTLRHGTRVTVGGLVVARQRPGTANGIVFVLLEDEFGTINLIVPAPIYERHRLTVRTEPLMLAEGKLEALPAAGGAINILVDRVQPIAAPDHLAAEVKDFSMLDEQVRRGLAEQRSSRETDAEDFRAVAPPVMSFASGRRR